MRILLITTGVLIGSLSLSFLACTLGVYVLDRIVIALINAYKPEPGSNDHLRAWLLQNPEKPIEAYCQEFGL